MPTNVRGVILDMDGTLVDSNPAHAQTWVEALQASGYPVTLDVVRPLIGLGGDKIIPRLTGHTEDSDLGKAIAARRSDLFEKQHLPVMRAFPKVRELVEQMRQAGLKVVIASSSQRSHLERLIERAGIEDLLDAATSASDVEDSKPDPDVIQAALGKLGLPPEQALMIGDTPYDIEAAAYAGVRTIALRCGGWEDAGLTGAIAVYDDPADLLTQFAASPLRPS